MYVIEENGYVKVYRKRDKKLICAASIRVREQREAFDLTFMDDADRKCNRTRQAACEALKTAGYR